MSQKCLLLPVFTTKIDQFHFPHPTPGVQAGMVHSVSGWTRGVQVKLWDPLRTSAIRPTWAP